MPKTYMEMFQNWQLVRNIKLSSAQLPKISYVCTRAEKHSQKYQESMSKIDGNWRYINDQIIYIKKIISTIGIRVF